MAMEGNPLVQLKGIKINHFSDQSTGEIVRMIQLHCLMFADDEVNTFRTAHIENELGERVIGQEVHVFTCPRGVDWKTLKIDGMYRLIFNIAFFGKKTVAQLGKLVPAEWEDGDNHE